MIDGFALPESTHPKLSKRNKDRGKARPEGVQDLNSPLLIHTHKLQAITGPRLWLNASRVWKQKWDSFREQ